VATILGPGTRSATQTMPNPNLFAPRRLALCGLATVLHFSCTLITDVDRSKIPEPASTFVDAGGGTVPEPKPKPEPNADAGGDGGLGDAGLSDAGLSDGGLGDAAATDAAPGEEPPLDTDAG